MSAIRLVLAAVAVLAAGPVLAQEAAAPPPQTWSFAGPLGRYDRAAARRGWQVYAESCAACHSMNFLHYRDLAGIGLTEAEIATISANVTVPSGFDAQGNVVSKPGTPASGFRAPFPSEAAAREALNGALPPDLSLAVSAFADGPNYIYALLTGYRDPPAGTKLADGMSFNTAFAGHQIAMPPPLNEGQISYADGTPSSVAQNAHDVVTFLAWAANPEMEQRKRLGGAAVLYFLAMAGLTYALKRRIWRRVH